MHYLRTRNDAPQQLDETRMHYDFRLDKQVKSAGGNCDFPECRKTSTATFQSVGAIGTPHAKKTYNVNVCAQHYTDKHISIATHMKHGETGPFKEEIVRDKNNMIRATDLLREEEPLEWIAEVQEKIDEEIIGKPGTFEHFAYHCRNWLHHADKVQGVDATSLDHGRKADTHQTHLIKHYGKDMEYALGDSIMDHHDIKPAWDQHFSKKGPRSKSNPLKETTYMSRDPLVDFLREQRLDEMDNRYKSCSSCNGVEAKRDSCTTCNKTGFVKKPKSTREKLRKINRDLYGVHKEDVEPLDEISKKTLLSYRDKALPTVSGLRDDLGSENAALRYDRYFQKKHPDGHVTHGMGKTARKIPITQQVANSTADRDKASSRLKNRKKGIATATKRLTKEEVAQLDEAFEVASYFDDVLELLEDYASILGENIQRRLVINKKEGLSTTDAQDANTIKLLDKLKTARPETPEEWNKYQQKMSRVMKRTKGIQAKKDGAKADELAKARLGGRKSILDLS